MPQGNQKLNVVITGRRNAGKSSILNCLLGQERSIVSEVAGTTTDPVRKSYEIPGYATVTFVDTAGIDDVGPLGNQRTEKTWGAVEEADAGIILFCNNSFGPHEESLAAGFIRLEIPFFILHGKSDLVPLAPEVRQDLENRYGCIVADFSAMACNPDVLTGYLRKSVSVTAPAPLTGDLIKPGSLVVLITPIDPGAPTGRMILPQVQVLRDVLDHRGICIFMQPEELPAYLHTHPIAPDLVITDSQAFRQVADLVPGNIPLTSFSILLARQKGFFNEYLKGTEQISRLQDGDRILMLESCSHHVTCEDIGRVKIPGQLRKYCGKQLEFDYITGLDKIRRPISSYSLIIQCGGCMVTTRQLRNRLRPAIEAGIPVSNYGMALAYVQGIFRRTTAIFRTVEDRK